MAEMSPAPAASNAAGDAQRASTGRPSLSLAEAKAEAAEAGRLDAVGDLPNMKEQRAHGVFNGGPAAVGNSMYSIHGEQVWREGSKRVWWQGCAQPRAETQPVTGWLHTAAKNRRHPAGVINRAQRLVTGTATLYATSPA